MTTNRRERAFETLTTFLTTTGPSGIARHRPLSQILHDC